METTSGDNQKKSKHFFWFVLGWIMLFLMALMASLDGSFFYIFLSLACIFFFVGFWNSPRVRASMFSKERSHARQAADEARQQYQKHAQTTSSPVSHSTNSRKIVWIASAFIGFVFMVITLPIIFSSDDTSSEEDTMLGTQYYEMGQCDSAKVLYKRAMKKDSENVGAMVGYGNALWCFERFDSALVMFNKALTLDNENELARYGRAAMYSQMQQYDQALKEFKSLLEDNPEYYNAMYLLGNVYYNQNNFAEALPMYEKAYSNGIRDRWICHLMAYLYEKKNEIPKAIPLYRESLSYDSTNIDVYIKLGELLPGNEGAFFRRRAAQLK